MDKRIKDLIDLMDEAYDSRSWHGTNLRGSLRGLTAREAAWRPAPGRHNIWEIVVHAAYWKYAVRRRILGEKRGSFALGGSNWFVRPERATTEAWREDIALLGREHKALRETLAHLDSELLDRRATRSTITFGKLLRGIAAHDLYHAGAIQMIKRLQRGVSSAASRR
jgi:hypothetical protein